MTMSSAVSKVTLNGDGVQTSWPFSFKVWKASDLEVILTSPGGTESVTTDWSVALAGVGGTVTYPVLGDTLPTGWKITIRRSMDFLQEVDLVSGTRWDPEVVETALDQAAAERQQLREEIGRAIRVGVASAEDPSVVLNQVFEARDDAAASAGAAAASELDAAASAVAAQLAVSKIGVLTAEGTLTTGQDTITLPFAYDFENEALAVYLGGIRQNKASLTFVDAYTVTLDTPVSTNTDYIAASLTLEGESLLTDLRDGAVAAKDDAEDARDTVLGALTDYVTKTGVETITNKTLTGYSETVFALSGTAPALDPDNGTIQTWTLTANSSPTDALAAGQSMTLMVADGTAFSITWPTMTWVGGIAPVLATSGYTVIVLWKIGINLYGRYVGVA